MYAIHLLITAYQELSRQIDIPRYNVVNYSLNTMYCSIMPDVAILEYFEYACRYSCTHILKPTFKGKDVSRTNEMLQLLQDVY